MNEYFLICWNNYWFNSMKSERENLGLFRICFYLLCMVIVFFSYKEKTLYVDENFYQPVYFYKMFDWIHQSSITISVAKYCFAIFSFFSLIGLATRIVTKLSFLSAFYLFAPFQNYGSYQHLGSTIIISMLIVSLSSCGDAFSLDRLIKKKFYGLDEITAPPGVYSWPLAMLKFVWCFIFFSAGILKLSTNGLDWLRFNMLAIFIERFNPLYSFNMPNAFSTWLREIIVDHYWVGRLGTISSLLLELSMPLMLFNKKLKFIFLTFAIGFLFSVMILMGHHFYYTLLPYLLGILFYEVNVIEYLKRKKLIKTHENI